METNITAISKSAPEDISMDYERLRTEGIRHLEDLATYIWTDFNVHDPGITILEVLCYAITDLGYRANLPIEDLLAKGDGSFQDTFFTAKQVLPICPVTQNDFRKILIDFPGIRNAWVEKADPDDPKIYLKKELIEDRTVNNKTGFICWLIKKLEGLSEDVLEKIIKKLNGETEDETRAGSAEKNLYREDVNCLRLIVDTTEMEAKNRKCLDLLVQIADLWVEHESYTKSYYRSKFRGATEEEVIGIIKEALSEYFPREDEDAFALRVEELKDKLLDGPSAGEDDLWEFDMEYLLTCIDNSFPTYVPGPEEEEPQSPGTGEENATGDPCFSGMQVLNNIRIKMQIVDEIICRFRCFEMCFDAERGTLKYASEIGKKVCLQDYTVQERICLNGLYRICLDTHAPIDPKSKAARKLIGRILKGYVDEVTCKEYKGLYSYRNLCEDFHSIQIAPTQNICLCLDIDVDVEADENEVMAEVMFRLQEFLTPPVPFHTLQQLLEQGLPCDEIFNGPLLCNGFIDDRELESAVIPEKIRLSDLYHLILEVKHVKTVNGLKIKNEEDTCFVEDWCFDYRKELESECPVKPVINLCCSPMYVRKGGVTHTIREQDISDLIELMRLGGRNLSGGIGNTPALPHGTFREDLSEFVSVQYEFPHNYAIGEHGVPPAAPLLRKAQVKQLQAYLLFFDRLLADYLKQLSQVSDLFSVCQDTEMPTYFYQALYGIPGVKDLIKDAVYEITADCIADLERANIPPVVIQRLESVAGNIYHGVLAFDEAMGELLESDWRVYESQIKNAFGRRFQTEQEWEEYQGLEDSYYLNQLRNIVEKEDTQFQRKHRLINHLLARFGEVFTEYTARVFETRENHLRAKADFLKSLPELGLERAKSYNYRAKDKLERDVDVWNTTNVAGLKKRIYGLLGWGQATTESVFSDPDYRIDEVEDRGRDLPFRYFVLNKLDGNNRPDGPPLLRSVKSYSPRKSKQIKPKLYVLINNAENYFKDDSRNQSDQHIVVFKADVVLKGKRKETIRMESVDMSETEADHLLEQIKRLIDVELKGGFHFIENILLRPNDKGDELLQMSFTCDLHFCPVDPYSFWLTVLAPAWKGPFQDQEYREYFMQLMHKEVPAHIAICFKWVMEEDTMEKLEDALEQWREALADCTPDECETTTKANVLIRLLNAIPCDCYCFSPNPRPSKCESLGDKPVVQ